MAHIKRIKNRGKVNVMAMPNEDELKNMKADELRKLCEAWNIDYANNKGEAIENLLAAVNSA